MSSTSNAPHLSAPTLQAGWQGGWHVSPVVDVVAYGFSWLLILVPLALMGDAHPVDYLALWAAGITVSFLHRHFTMPYVYLDGGVFQAHRMRFTLMPAVLFCGFIASVLLQHAKIPRGFFTALDVATLLGAVVVVVDLWRRDRALTNPERIGTGALVAAAAPFALATALGAFGLFRSHHTASVVVVAVAVSGASFVASAGPGGIWRRWPSLGRAGLPLLVGVVLIAGVLAHAQWGALHAGKLRGSVVVGAVAMVAALWNIWHTAAQKVGILRVYNAKSQAPPSSKPPLWSDRLLVLGWFPLLGPLLMTRERDTILEQGKVVRVWLEPLVDVVTAAAPVAIPLGVVVVVVSLLCFARFELRAADGQWRRLNKPRLMMALGMTGLSASFLVVNPLKVYVAYGFSHAVEYVVFVMAFQQKRYAVPHQPPPLLQRMLRHSWLFYGVFCAIIGGTYFYVEFGQVYGFFDGKLRLLGFNVALWVYAWAIWHSLAHFYFDGFLWKMRAPAVRAHL